MNRYLIVGFGLVAWLTDFVPAEAQYKKPTSKPSTSNNRPSTSNYRPPQHHTTPSHQAPAHRPSTPTNVNPHQTNSGHAFPVHGRPAQPQIQPAGNAARPYVLNPGATRVPVRVGAQRPAMLLSPPSGVKIWTVHAGPAARQGLRQGDTILSFGGRSTLTVDDLVDAVKQAGGEARMVYINGETGEQESVVINPENNSLGLTVETIALGDGPSEANPNGTRAAMSVTGTTWSGNENLAGFGDLTFVFGNDGSALMIDAQSRVRGSWSQDGKAVRISFNNCVYQGIIQDGQLSGSAQYLEGQRRSWSFQVALRRE